MTKNNNNNNKTIGDLDKPLKRKKFFKIWNKYWRGDSFGLSQWLDFWTKNIMVIKSYLKYYLSQMEIVKIPKFVFLIRLFFNCQKTTHFFFFFFLSFLKWLNNDHPKVLFFIF